MIIIDYISNWNSILKNINKNTIAEKFIDHNIKVKGCGLENSKNVEKKKKILKLSDFLKEEGSGKYLTNIFHLIKNEYKNKIIQDINILNPPLKIYSNYTLEYSQKNCKQHLQSHQYFRKFICQLKGKKTYFLFHQKEAEKIYPSSKYKNFTKFSKINFWNNNYTLYPKFKDCNYIQINIDEGQILSIPPYWWYASESLNESISLEIDYDNFFNLISFTENYVSHCAHKLGFKQNFNCVCCE